jgi:fibronectin type 3 domain-containing protein
MLALLTACERERIVDPGADDIAPLPPAALLVEGARDGYIFISWIRNRELDLRGYIIYRAEESDPSGFVAIDTTSLFYFIDEQRSYDTAYSYFVTAIDETGNESSPSNTVSARSRNVYPPDSPLEFNVNGFNDGTRRMIRLSWSTVNEADIAEYHIYRSDVPFDTADSSLLVAAGDAALFDDLGATQTARRYFYAVTALDRGGLESALSRITSDYISSRPVLLSPMENRIADTYPLLLWKRVPEAAAYLLTVSLSENTGEFWSKTVMAELADTLSFRYTGAALSAGETYFWRVSTITALNGKPNGISDAWRFQVRN